MDGSDQEDFVDLCSKQLKRVRKKPPDPGEPRSADPQPRAPDFPKRRRRKNDVRAASASKATPQTDKPTPASDPIQLKHPLKHDGAELGAGVSGSSVSGADDQAVEADDQAVEAGLAAAQKVVRSMQQFKRCSPQKLSRGDRIQLEIRQDHHDGPPVLPCQDLQDIDQALAVRLQEEMDREARAPPRGGLEERGLFFCQLCHRDLSHMSPTGRTQHTNRCLDESEDSAPCASAPPPAIPECPICGKLFKTLKSRSAHLKRCSSHMGVAPAVLLQALQKQATEALSDGSASQSVQTGGSKRKGPKSDPSHPVRKKPRKRAPNLDEDTMVALALSSSLLEQERKREVEVEREREAMAAAVPPGSVAALLRWQAHEVGRRGKKKRKKGSAPRPPPLLLVQDPDAALRRLQDRVAALLLRTRAPSPPTPTLRPSSLPAWCSARGGGDEGGAPLWKKSALRDGGPRCAVEFYTAELREFIFPPEETQTAPSPPPSSPGSSTQAGAGPGPGGGSFPVGSQALADLLDLAEEGMTLTQWGYSSSGKGKDSGVAPEGDLCLSGFILDDTHTRSQRDDTHTHTQRSDTHTRSPRRTDVQTVGQSSVAPLSRLTSDLSSMVNNPQLSDIQLQVDDGEVYFAHSFMLYARCPLLAHTVHDSGFGVKEDGSPAAQRLLLSEVPGPAVSTLLLYLYTARCSPKPSLLPHLQQLACRFDLPELQELCRDPPGHTELQEETGGEGQACRDNPDRELPSGEEKSGDQAFMELLRSMWNEEEEDGGEGVGGGEGVEGEMGVEEEEGREEGVALEDEERVNEKELEEIYEFAATQRKREEGKEHTEEEGEAGGEEEEAGRNAGAMEQENISLDRSYNRLFSDSWGDYEDRDPPSQPPRSQPPPSVSQPLRARDGRRGTEETPCLHSTVSEVIDLSISPPASRPSVPDLSPGEGSPAWARRDPSEGVGAGEDRGEDRDHVSAYGGASQKKVGSDEEKPSPKRTAQGARSASLPRSPLRARREPELIVLSDSSEEMEVDPPPGGISPSPPPPPSPPTQNQQDFTQIRPHPEPGSPHLEGEVKSLSPPEGHLTEPGPDPEAHSPLMDFSPEVSWLIPATPLQARTNSSSTQTQSSMRRTRLFPKTSSSSSAGSSSLQTSSDPPPASTHPAQTERPISRVKSASQGSSLDGDLSPKKRGRTAIDKNAEGDSDSSQVFTIPSSRPRWLSYPSLPPSLPLIPPSDPSAKGTPVHCLPQPHSSTPLHPDLPEPPALPSASPLLRGGSERHAGWPRGRADTQIPGRTGLGTLRLSLSDSPCMGSPSRGPVPRRPPAESGDASSTGSRKLTMEGEEEMRVEERRTSHGGEEKEGMEAKEGSRGRSFLAMDEPPMAFDDSWGLNACDGPSEQEVCFSLRMDSTGAQSSLSPPPPPSLLTIPPSPSPPPIAHLHPATPSSTCSPPASAQAVPQGEPELGASLPGSKLWSDWEEEEAEVGPLSQRVNTVAPAQRVDQLRTPVASRRREQLPLEAITPLPCYSDMDTPDLKNKLNRFGVRPLPKRQMILKLKEIHHYTHQLVSSESDDEAPSLGKAPWARPLPSSTASSRPAPCASGGFKQPGAPPAASPVKRGREEEQEPLSASQGSSTSSTAASDDSERSNPELCPLSDEEDGSDGDLTSSQAFSRLQDRLQAARRFILSDPELYGRVLQYQPLGLALLQARLKQAGITLGTAKLMDFLDANCITFTTAKPGQGRKQRRGGGGRGGGGRGRGGRRKKVVAPTVTN